MKKNKKKKARKELREIMAAYFYLRGRPRANYTPIDLKGPDAIEVVLKTLELNMQDKNSENINNQQST